MGGLTGGDAGGNSGSQSFTQTTEPWSVQKPYLKTGFQAVKQNFLNKNTYPQFYPQQTVVPFSPETQLAQKMIDTRAINRSPIQTAANNQLSSLLNGDYVNQVGSLYNNPMQQLANNQAIAPTINGDYLYGGPGFNAAFQAASNKIIPQVNSAFEAAGRGNSGLAQQAETQALSDAFASQYGQERQNQLSAAGLAQQGTGTFLDNINQAQQNQMRGLLFAPQMMQMDYTDPQMLAQVGAQKEDLQQQLLNQSVNNWDFNQNMPRQSVAQYMNLIQGNYGGTTSGSSSSTVNNRMGAGNPLMSGLSGMLGAAMFPQAGISPMSGLLMGLL